MYQYNSPLLPSCLILLAVCGVNGNSFISDDDHVQCSEEKLSNCLLSLSYKVISKDSSPPLSTGYYRNTVFLLVQIYIMIMSCIYVWLYYYRYYDTYSNQVKEVVQIYSN